MTWPSFASACPMSTIWSSRARKRSFCPLFRRSFGRIESTSAKLTAEENHGQRRRSICKKSSRQTLLSCNCKDSKKPTIPQKTRRLRILHGRLFIYFVHLVDTHPPAAQIRASGSTMYCLAPNRLRESRAADSARPVAACESGQPHRSPRRPGIGADRPAARDRVSAHVPDRGLAARVLKQDVGAAIRSDGVPA